MDLSKLNPQQIKDIISLLQSLLPESEDISSHTQTIAKSHASTKKTTQNNFENMPEFRMHKEDTILDKKLSINAPVPRSREFRPVNVICRSCGKKETVAPSLVDSIDRYKCNKCCSNNG